MLVGALAVTITPTLYEQVLVLRFDHYTVRAVHRAVHRKVSAEVLQVKASNRSVGLRTTAERTVSRYSKGARLKKLTASDA